MGAASHCTPLGNPQRVQKVTSVPSVTPCVAARCLEEPIEPQEGPGSYRPAKEHSPCPRWTGDWGLGLVGFKGHPRAPGWLSW